MMSTAEQVRLCSKAYGHEPLTPNEVRELATDLHDMRVERDRLQRHLDDIIRVVTHKNPALR